MATTWRPALIIRFTGPRFESYADDFDVASELASLKAIIVKTAEELWRCRHAKRARVPKSFADAALLRFREVKRGGVVTVLERGREDAGQLAIPLAGASGDDELDAAIDLIVGAVRAASRGQPLPPSFPKEALPLFGAFGRGLGEDDRCELHTPNAPEPPSVYGQDTRVALLRLLEGEGLDVAAVVGHVPSIGRKSFELYGDLEGDPGVFVPLSDAFAEVVFAASREYGRVLVQGLGVFDDDGRLVRFVEVDSIEPVDSPSSWGGAASAWEGLPSLSKCRPDEARWSDPHTFGEDLNAYIYGIGR